MKRFIVLICIVLSSWFAQAQPQQFSDKDMANIVWALGMMYPDGFSLDLNTLRNPTEGLLVSYAATQNSTDRKSIPFVLKHARAHQNLVGGWFNPQD